MDFTQLKNSISLEEANERLRHIEDRLRRASSHSSSPGFDRESETEGSCGISNDPGSSKESSSFDWTRIYGLCDKYEDVEALKSEAALEESRAKENAERALLSSAHSHDHAEERAMFELPEPEKMRRCESHRLLGNYLFNEGRHMAPKAAEQYKLAIAYYDYCFPESDEEQEQLNAVKYASYCNLSLCYLLMGLFTEAVESATRAIGKTTQRSSADTNIRTSGSSSVHWEVTSKAYYRRAQALRRLHRFEEAARDLQVALSLTPSDHALGAEIIALKTQKERYGDRSRELASRMLTTADTSNNNKITANKYSDINQGDDANSNISSEPALLDWDVILDLDMPVEPFRHL